jgi:hypothetical protein
VQLNQLLLERRFYGFFHQRQCQLLCLDLHLIHLPFFALAELHTRQRLRLDRYRQPELLQEQVLVQELPQLELAQELALEQELL